eukprot:5043631-Amphidinium_carterae.1
MSLEHNTAWQSCHNSLGLSKVFSPIFYPVHQYHKKKVEPSMYCMPLVLVAHGPGRQKKRKVEAQEKLKAKNKEPEVPDTLQ